MKFIDFGDEAVRADLIQYIRIRDYSTRTKKGFELSVAWDCGHHYYYFTEENEAKEKYKELLAELRA